MSGRIGETTTVTLVMNIEISCEHCIQFIIEEIKKIQGVGPVTRGENQLTVVQKIPSDKIRKNTFFSKPHNMNAVLGINIDCDGCKKKMDKIVKSTPGYESIVPDFENRLFTVKGVIAINTLAKKLEKKIRKFVRIVSVNVKCGGGSGGACSNPYCRIKTEDLMKKFGEMLK